MDLDFWFKAGLVTLGLAVLAFTFLMGKMKKTEPNSGALFKLGIIFLVAGIGGQILTSLFGGNGLDAFFVLGTIYIAVGLLMKRKVDKKV